MDNGCCEKKEKFCLKGGCPSVTSETANVTVPVAVRAFADVGEVELKCLGGAVVTRNSRRANGVPCGHGVSEFTISQRMRVDIPIKFNMETEIGEAQVEFESNGCDCPFCPN